MIHLTSHMFCLQQATHPACCSLRSVSRMLRLGVPRTEDTE